MGIKLGWRVFILFIISYVVFWAIFAELGLAIVVPLAYWYVENKFQKRNIYKP